METIELINSFRPFFIIVGVLIGLKISYELVWPMIKRDIKRDRMMKGGEKWRGDREMLQWLRGMNPSEFEEYVAGLFDKLGYKTSAVGGSGDGGIDVIAEKDGVKHYIQCKKFFGKRTVSVGEVRDFYGALADKLAQGKGYFITTNKFTLEAEKFAEDKPIELVDSFKLLEYVKLAGAFAPDVDKQSSSVCPKCGGGLIERKGKFGKFLGCNNFPKCRYTSKINSEAESR